MSKEEQLPTKPFKYQKLTMTAVISRRDRPFSAFLGETAGKMDTTPYEFASPSFKNHEFSTSVFGMEVLISVLKMEQSVLIWVGFKDHKSFSDLSLGIQSKFSSVPLSSQLLGNCSDVISKSLTSKLARKLGKAVYLSYNIPDKQMTAEIVKALISEIDTNPDCF